LVEGNSYLDLLAGVIIDKTQSHFPSVFIKTLVAHSYKLIFSPLYVPVLVPRLTSIPVF